MDRYLLPALTALLLLLLQTTVVPFLALGGAVPDLLLIWAVYLAIRRGQVEATAGGFVVGLLQDSVTTQFFGLAALAKTIAAFVAGYFFNENKTPQTLGTYRFALIVALGSFLHNLIYFGIFFQGTGVPLLETTLRVSFLTAAYTSLMSFLPVFAFARRYRVE